MAARFRKKPVVIEAMQYTGDIARDKQSSADEIISWISRSEGELSARVAYERNRELYVRTLEGEMHVSVGDWVIKGVKDEFYPCKPDIFEATYEAI